MESPTLPTEQANSVNLTNRYQLAILFDEYLSEISPVNSGMVGVAGAHTLVSRYVPDVTNHQISRAVRCFSGSYAVTFEQYTRMLMFFLNAEPYRSRRKKDFLMAMRQFQRRFEDLERSIKNMYQDLASEVSGRDSLVNLLMEPEHVKCLRAAGSMESSKMTLPTEVNLILGLRSLHIFPRAERGRSNDIGINFSEVIINMSGDVWGQPLRFKCRAVIVWNSNRCDMGVSMTLPLRFMPREDPVELYRRLQQARLQITLVQDATASTKIEWKTELPVIPIFFAAPNEIDLAAKLKPTEEIDDGRVMALVFTVSASDDPIVRHYKGEAVSTENDAKPPVVWPFRGLQNRCIESIKKEDEEEMGPDLFAAYKIWKEESNKKGPGVVLLVCGNVDFQFTYCVISDRPPSSAKQLNRGLGDASQVFDIVPAYRVDGLRQARPVGVIELHCDKAMYVYGISEDLLAGFRVDLCIVKQDTWLFEYGNKQSMSSVFEINWDFEDKNMWSEKKQQ